MFVDRRLINYKIRTGEQYLYNIVRYILFFIIFFLWGCCRYMPRLQERPITILLPALPFFSIFRWVLQKFREQLGVHSLTEVRVMAPWLKKTKHNRWTKTFPGSKYFSAFASSFLSLHQHVFFFFFSPACSHFLVVLLTLLAGGQWVHQAVRWSFSVLSLPSLRWGVFFFFDRYDGKQTNDLFFQHKRMWNARARLKLKLTKTISSQKCVHTSTQRGTVSTNKQLPVSQLKKRRKKNVVMIYLFGDRGSNLCGKLGCSSPPHMSRMWKNADVVF